MVGTSGASSRAAAAADEQLDRQVESIDRLLAAGAAADRDEIDRKVARGARAGSVLPCVTVEEERAIPLSRDEYGPTETR
jgi:hypothetical protein